jgi:hypothetical protein
VLPTLSDRFYTPMFREMIQFLAQMPADTKLFLTMTVLGLAATLIMLKWLI